MSTFALDTAPPSISRSRARRVVWSGNPPHAPIVWGWVIRLDRPATKEERAWFRANGFVFHGSKWGRPDPETT